MDGPCFPLFIEVGSVEKLEYVMNILSLLNIHSQFLLKCFGFCVFKKQNGPRIGGLPKKLPILG